MSAAAEAAVARGAYAMCGFTYRRVPAMSLARELVGRVQQEYVTRYGGPDEAVVDPAEFEPPVGLFLVAEVDGVPAGCGAWRVHAPGVAEVKRVYVAPEFRRLGLAQLLVAALEQGIPLDETYESYTGMDVDGYIVNNYDRRDRGRIDLVENLGGEQIVTCLVAGREVYVRTSREVIATPGDDIVLTAAPENVHLFDRASGRRLEWVADAPVADPAAHELVTA